MKWVKLGIGGAGALMAGAVFMFGVLAATGHASAAGPGETASRFAELLAGQLGITTDRLQQATTAARDQLLAEKVAAGELTQAQADAIKARPATLGVGGMGRGPVGRGVHVMVDAVQVTSQVTGYTVDQVRDQLRSGQSLAQIAASKGVSRDALKNALTTAYNTEIQKAVAAGRLTQAQATQMTANLSAMIDRIIDRTGFGGFGGGPHGPRPGMTPTPSSTQ